MLCGIPLGLIFLYLGHLIPVSITASTVTTNYNVTTQDSVPCDSNPCQNFSICTELDSRRYNCTCNPGFTQKNSTYCEAIASYPCDSNPCLYFGICTELDSTRYNCICNPGFTQKNSTYCEAIPLGTNYVNPCDSNPCSDYGKCTDYQSNNYSSYNCTCLPGFVEFYSEYCGDINECDDLSICGGFQCNNERGDYNCTCPQEYAGKNCELLRNSSEGRPQPIFESLDRNQVIMAGGSKVVLRGKNLHFLPYLRILLNTFDQWFEHIPVAIVSDLTSDTVIEFIMPPALSPKKLNKKLGVNVQYFSTAFRISPSDYIYTGFNITYVENPVFELITPTLLLADGGVLMYGVGHGFNAVEKIFLYTKIRILGGNEFSQHFMEECQSLNVTHIQCYMPNFNITQLLPMLRITTVDYPRRKKRGVEFSMERPIIRENVDGQSVEVYMGFTFDNYYHYRRLGESAPTLTLNLVFTNPVFKAELDELRIIKKHESLKIKGENVDVGCTIADYSVFLASNSCVVYGLSSNLIQCIPPQGRPLPEGKFLSYCSKWPNSLPIHINLGRNTATYFIGCGEYEFEWLDLFTTTNILSIVVGMFILLVVLLVATVICCKKLRRSKDLAKKGDSVNSSPAKMNTSRVQPVSGYIQPNVVEFSKLIDQDKKGQVDDQKDISENINNTNGFKPKDGYIQPNAIETKDGYIQPSAVDINKSVTEESKEPSTGNLYIQPNMQQRPDIYIQPNPQQPDTYLQPNGQKLVEQVPVAPGASYQPNQQQGDGASFLPINQQQSDGTSYLPMNQMNQQQGDGASYLPMNQMNQQQGESTSYLPMNQMNQQQQGNNQSNGQSEYVRPSK